MRKANVTILASILAIALAAAVVGAGTLAYFTDIETAEIGQFTSGTVDLLIAKGDENGPFGGWKDGSDVAITGPTNWVPGDTYEIFVWFKNTGTSSVDFMYRSYYAYWCDGGLHPESEIDGDNDVGKVIEVTGLFEWIDGSWGTTNWAAHPTWGWIAFHDDNDDGKLSLTEVIDMAPGELDWDEKIYEYGNWVAGVKQNEDSYFLDPGEMAALRMTFKFMEDADNRYQGDICGFKIAAGITMESIEWSIGPAEP